MRITTKEVREITSVIDDIIEEYKEKSTSKERDWRTYEQRVAKRLRTAYPLLSEVH